MALNNSKSKILIFGSLLSLLLLAFFYVLLVEVRELELVPKKAIPVTIVIIYYSFAYVVGWLFLHEYTSKWVKKLPPIGFIVYLIVHVFVSGYIGFFYLPYWVYLQIKS